VGRDTALRTRVNEEQRRERFGISAADSDAETGRLPSAPDFTSAETGDQPSTRSGIATTKALHIHLDNV